MRHTNKLLSKAFPQAAQIFFISEIQKSTSIKEIKEDDSSKQSESSNPYSLHFPFWPFNTSGNCTPNIINTMTSTTVAKETVQPIDLFKSPEDTTIDGDDLYSCLRPLLISAKIFGLLPIQGIFPSGSSKQLQNLKFKWFSPSALTSIFICGLLFFMVGMSLMRLLTDFGVYQEGRGGSVHRLILETRGPAVLIVGALTYTLFLGNTPRLLKVFKIWRKSTAGLLLTARQQQQDRHKRINCVAFSILIPGMIHVQLFHLSRVGVLDDSSGVEQGSSFGNMTRLEMHYSRYWPDWLDVMNNKALFAGFLFLIINFTTFALLFCDTLIISMSILLYNKFKALAEQTRVQLSQLRRKSDSRLLVFRKNSIDSIARANLWTDVRRDHLICMYLLWKTEEVLSPFIFISFATSIYCTCIQMHQGVYLSGNHGSYAESILAAIFLITLFVRMILLCCTAARVNEHATEINRCIQNCPNFLYHTELERLERMLSHSGSIGLTGLGGCFIVNKAFLLVIASVIFTFQIVLLQASTNSLRANQLLNGSFTTHQ